MVLTQVELRIVGKAAVIQSISETTSAVVSAVSSRENLALKEKIDLVV